jgi:biopolymer transport protein ExbB
MTVTANAAFWVLLAMAAASVVVYFERFFELRRASIDYQDFLKGIINILDAGNASEALAICEDTPQPVANVVATAIRHREGSARILREAVDSQGRAETGKLSRRLASLAIMGQIAPLVGLLGTVAGFVKTVALANSEVLVSRADLLGNAMDSLMTAAVGLAVAIVTAVMHGSLTVRLDRAIVELEAAASQIVGYISSRPDAAERERRR